MNAPVLLVESDSVLLETLKKQFEAQDRFEVLSFNDPYLALVFFKQKRASVLVLDAELASQDGIDLARQIADLDSCTQVILMSSRPDIQSMRNALKAGIFDYVIKPFVFADIFESICQAVELYQQLVQRNNYQLKLEEMVVEKTQKLSRATHSLGTHFLNTLYALINAIEANDSYTEGHSKRVTALSVLLGSTLGLDAEQINLLRLGSLLHDLGKIGIDWNLLKKESWLSIEELDVMREHPKIGAKIIEPIGLPEDVTKIILQHHEWYNGNGYPNGIKDYDIHPLAKIVAIADAYDAMNSKRPYREPMNPMQAASEIRNKAGIQFDTLAAEAFYENHASYAKIMLKKENIESLVFG